MENLHLNHSEDRITKGIAELKSLPMPNPPAGLVHRMSAADAPRRGRFSPRAWALAACGGLILATFALMPRRSSAAISMERLVSAYGSAEVLFHVTPYWIEGKTRTPKIWSGFVKGERWRYVQKDYEQAWDGKHVTAYFVNEGRARIWECSASDADAQSVLASADLSWWKSPDREGLRLDHNVRWGGRLVDRYEVTTHSDTWGPTTNTLYADPVANRPIYAEYLHGSGNGNAMKWDYPNPADESVLRIKMKAGTKVEDVTAEMRMRARRPKEATRANSNR
jgi:hypothetical protein